MLPTEEEKRKLIINLSKKGKTTREIADILNVSKSKSAFWVKRYKDTRSLKDKPQGGRPTSLTKEKLGIIKEIIISRLLKVDRINSKEVLELIENETSKKYTLRHTQRLLNKMGFIFIKGWRSIYDPRSKKRIPLPCGKKGWTYDSLGDILTKKLREELNMPPIYPAT